MTGAGEASRPWQSLAPDYERARAREDSLDTLVEWPAQRELIGDVRDRSVLDLGCGNGAKLAELVADGAVGCVGVDISGTFPADPPPHLQLVRGDLSDVESLAEVDGRTFDRILFLQSFGYASDPVRTLRAARDLLADDGFIVLTRTQPIRHAVEQSELNGTPLGDEYFSRASFTHAHSWNPSIDLAKSRYTVSDLLNTFSAAGLRVETAVEPQLSEEARARFPHKQEWMGKHLGILAFRLRSLR